MLGAFEKRPERLGILVCDSGDFFHNKLGDMAHRFSVRSGATLVVRPLVSLPFRSVVSLLIADGRVACFVDDSDDVEHAARRIAAVSLPWLSNIQTVVWDEGVWNTYKLSELI